MYLSYISKWNPLKEDTLMMICPKETVREWLMEVQMWAKDHPEWVMFYVIKYHTFDNTVEILEDGSNLFVWSDIPVCFEIRQLNLDLPAWLKEILRQNSLQAKRHLWFLWILMPLLNIEENWKAPRDWIRPWLGKSMSGSYFAILQLVIFSERDHED